MFPFVLGQVVRESQFLSLSLSLSVSQSLRAVGLWVGIACLRGWRQGAVEKEYGQIKASLARGVK